MLLAPLSSIASRDVVTLAESATINAAVSLMAEHSIHDVIVISPEKDLHIITAKIVMTLRLADFDFSRPLSEAHLPQVPCMQYNERVSEGITVLRDSPTEHLCLVNEQQELVGIVSYSDLITHLDPGSLAETRRIKDLLNLSSYSSLRPDDNLKTAMLTMHSAGHSAALIMPAEQGVGIITQSDITSALQNNADWMQPVTRFMTSPALTVQEELTLQEALSISRKEKLKRLVVCNAAGQVVGLLHQKELVALVYESWREMLRRQEESLKAALDATENEQRWRAVLEGTQQGVWDWNAQTNKVFFSPTWKSMLGYAEDEISDSLDEWDSRIHPDDKAATYADLERHFSGETSVYENTHRVRCKDGSYKWILDKGKVFSTDADGRPLRVIGTHTDVTDEYEQKQQLNRLAGNVPGALYQYRLFPDGTSSFPFATANISDVYGVSPAQVKEDAQIVLERLHPDDAELVATTISESADRLTVWEVQYRYNHPEKGERWLEGRATPEKMVDGSVIWNGYIYDITERKRQELKLAETTAQFQLTMEATNTGLWSWDLVTNEVNWSPEAYSMLGYEPDAFPVTLEKFQSLMHPDDVQGMMSDVMSSIEQGDGFNVQFRLRHAEGRWVWIQGRGKVTGSDGTGKPVFMMGTHADISEIKQVEQALAEARAAADTASRAKSDFLANMSHEIRTPMSSIIGLSQISVDEQDLTTLHDRLRKIHHSGRLLLGIINDILDFSKIEAGKLSIDPQPFFLTGLVDNLNSLFADMASRKNLQLSMHIDEGVGDAFVGDELRLRQVLTNLIGNAIKFTEQGSIQLVVSAHQSSVDRQWLKFSVLDTGIGITQEQRQKLFNAFSQADNSVTRKHGGSGLGLVISQRLVEVMGGSGIELESQPEQGSVFTFILPLRACDASEQEMLLHKKSETLDENHSLQGRVLLVEDNPINQEVARSLLEKLGLEVTVAQQGAEALEQVEQSDFNLILMDIQMPVMDGYEATRQLRARGCELPIIALTAAAMAEDQAKALAAGMNSHLSKPIDPQALQQVLAQWLKAEATESKSCQSAAADTQSNPDLTSFESEREANPCSCFDAGAGLVMLSGNRQLYRKVLKEFLQQLGSDYQQLPGKLRYLQTEPSPEAIASLQKLAHSLKGVAGNLALQALAALATSLDRALKQSEVPTETEASALEQCLQQTTAEIERWLENEESAEQAQPGRSNTQNRSVQSELQTLLAAIQNSQFVDESELQALAEQLPEEAHTHWHTLCQALDDFEFEQASEILSQLILQLTQSSQ
jgi:PAS domain S-box-containing protein